jgi:hypothetical protein
MELFKALVKFLNFRELYFIMDCVLIGVSDRKQLRKIKDYEKFVSDYGQFLAKHFENVIVTPDDGVYTDIALEFGRIKGKKPIAYYPDKDTFYGYEHLKKNFHQYEVREINGDWYKLNADLTKQARVVICLGFSPGVLIELSFIKYHQKYGKFRDPRLKNIHLLIDRRTIDWRLPRSFDEQIENIFYYSSLRSLEKILNERREYIE